MGRHVDSHFMRRSRALETPAEHLDTLTSRTNPLLDDFERLKRGSLTRQFAKAGRKLVRAQENHGDNWSAAKWMDILAHNLREKKAPERQVRAAFKEAGQLMVKSLNDLEWERTLFSGDHVLSPYAVNRLNFARAQFEEARDATRMRLVDEILAGRIDPLTHRPIIKPHGA